ncbi:hypothetical protein LUZ62_064231 [Rhynchospora pubera]|uniref:Pentatricopeptide repeat-containing protein-mitochondrial domain-containing protein n=1 Tax=Rhynchospora pubera TaxID=906938 RepID=A0AAV8EHQ0_9POAL|nr:hypothetical protein LUZ62_064231 [Rhynchospora pubera]
MNEIEKAQKLVDEMVSKGILSNTVTCNIIVDALCKKGEAEKLLDLMVREGTKPGVVSYQALLMGYTNEGNIDGVMNVLDRMQINNEAPEYATCTSLIVAFAKNRMVDEAMRVLKRMEEEGVKTDLSAYAPILKQLLQMGCVDYAKDLVDQAIGKTNG